MRIPDFIGEKNGLARFVYNNASDTVYKVFAGTFLPPMKNLTKDPSNVGVYNCYITLLPTYTFFSSTGEARAELTVRIITKNEPRYGEAFWNFAIKVVDLLTSQQCIDAVNYITRMDCTSFTFLPWENAGEEFYSATALFDVYLQMK